MQYDLWSYKKRLEDIDENKEEDHDSGDRGWNTPPLVRWKQDSSDPAIAWRWGW